MSDPTADVAAKVSTDSRSLLPRDGGLYANTPLWLKAAEKFVTSYYSALSSSRNTISSFYIPPATMPDGKTLPTIVFNGNVISDASTFQIMFEKEMPAAHYDIQSFNCHMVNPNYTAIGSEGTPGTTGKNMTILVMVSGSVSYGKALEGEQRMFSESIVLVPNPTNTAGKGKGGSRKGWLIQSQNFRFV
ncbi:MAG: hypothetical protein M1812_000559 [Candelaria pacifica]|nr:MAG: hypothetical protein M1812_000559 [Candelaria pacifica]